MSARDLILAGVAGWPVAHSLSPLLHAHWLKIHGIAGAYLPLPIRPEHFARAADGLAVSGFAGVNVTVPHKQTAANLASRRDADTETCGAANLLLFRSDGMEARNTDVDGLAASLREGLGAGGHLYRNVIVLGAGGAARATVLACERLRGAEITVLARKPGQAEKIVERLGGHIRARLRARAMQDWEEVAQDASLLVNATSAGMKGTAPLALSLAPLPRAAAVCDLVYDPLRTPLLADAIRGKHAIVDGLGMLMHQAVPAFEAFFGVRPRVTPQLRALLEQALAS